MCAATSELFDASTDPQAIRQTLCEGAVLMRGFALTREREILHEVEEVIRAAPWRRMLTPGGLRMSVMTTQLRRARLDQRPTWLSLLGG